MPFLGAGGNTTYSNIFCCSFIIDQDPSKKYLKNHSSNRINQHLTIQWVSWYEHSSTVESLCLLYLLLYLDLYTLGDDAWIS